jgi:aminopeptidase
MDERVREHASVLIDWSARIEAGDDVVVHVGPDAHELGVAVAAELGDRGANMTAVYASDELTRAYLQAHDGAFEDDHAAEQSLYREADSVFFLGGTRNTSATADVDPETRKHYRMARQEIREARLDTDWVSTVHPTRALAQQAGMSYEAYQEFVYDAVLRDWESLAGEMAQLKDLLDGGTEVRLVSDETDLTLGIENRTAVNSAASVAYDSHNLPSGEVFTAPASAEGTVLFDVPMAINGRRVEDVRLTLEAGEVVEYSAAAGEDVIAEILETDAGARRLGELGIGMNRGIDRVTNRILFDEKMAQTVHLALGRAYDANLPEGESGNDSAVHQDLIADVSTDSRLEIDGEVVQRDGRFRWEDGFETAA